MQIRPQQLLTGIFCSTVLSSSLPLCAQEIASRPEKVKFELSATVNSDGAAQAAQVVPKPAPNFAKIPAIMPNLEPQIPEPDNGFLKEYNVDWSRWISNQADRWYYNLKTTETMFGLGFVTERPAIIQFTCYANGSIGNVVLKQSCGIPVYDRLQIETLLATMPLMPFPAGTQRSSITLSQGWESKHKKPGDIDFQVGSFGRNFPKEKVQQWVPGR